MSRYDAVICGAGVGGLSLAIALGQQGRRVLLLEKQRTEVPVHKGEFLQPRTLQILSDMKVLPQLMEQGALRTDVLESRNAQGKFLGALDYRLLPQPFNYGLAHYYREIKAALWTHIHDLVEVSTGTRVVGLLRTANGRIMGVRTSNGKREEEVEAMLTVGADGRVSTVREQAEIQADIYTYPHQMLALDLAHITHLEPHILNFLSKHGMRTLYPLPGNRARLYIQILPGEFRQIKAQGMPAWRHWLLENTPGLHIIADHLPDDFKEVQILGAWSFCAPRWNLPGLILIGDAAHSVHPMAGQGMNAAIADAWTLTQAIREYAAGCVLTERRIDQALAHYDHVRRPQFQYVARLSHSMSVLCTTASLFGRLMARQVVRANQSNLRLQYIVTYNMSGLGVRRFTWFDRLCQFGVLPDPHASSIRL